jgi:DNA-binding transcriptional LysR family regulator
MYDRRLEVFIRVAESGSFRKTAEELYISPQAVIKQINVLEDSMNLRLFARSHRGIVLTTGGKILYQETGHIIKYCQNTLARAQAAMQEKASVIRIGTSPITPAQVLVKLWPQIYKYCADVKFTLVNFDNCAEDVQEILDHLGKHIDLLVGMFDEKLLSRQQLCALRLSDEPLCCALPVIR